VSALVHSEVLKVMTVRTFLWVTLANVSLVFVAALTVALSTGSIQSAEDDRSAAQIASVSLLMALIGGILVMAGEGTHGTITQTLLVTPIRERVFLAKAAVAACFGFALAVISEILTLAVINDLDLHNARLVLLGTLIGAPLAGALGVGLGALFHGQGSAIAVSLVWLLIGEGFAALLRGDTEKYTPGRAFGSLVSGVTSQEGLLGMTGGGFVAALWTAIFLVAGALTLLGRDV
jgi:ABC-2 type transport system permease protein